MTESGGGSTINVPQIPIEIVSDEEMALIEAALAATRSCVSSSSIPAISFAAGASFSFSSSSSSSSSPLLRKNARSIESISRLSKRGLSACTGARPVCDIEDSGKLRSLQKKVRMRDSLFYQFRRRSGLFVTDFSNADWCEKKVEFTHRLGKPEMTEPMKAGKARHAELEEEVVKRVIVDVEKNEDEDKWALKFIKFILGANQLLSEGLTRELPLLGFVGGVWMGGQIDEIRMPETETKKNPILVETKTRAQARSPAEAQQRTARFQLMFYKYLYDSSVAPGFPSRLFFEYFTLNPHYILSEKIRKSMANFSYPVKTLDDLVRYFRDTCCKLLPANDQLLLRYEYQEDNSLIGEDKFLYDSDWLKSQIRYHLEFWMGEREASYPPMDERWKCRSCKFSSVCPANTGTGSTSS